MTDTPEIAELSKAFDNWIIDNQFRITNADRRLMWQAALWAHQRRDAEIADLTPQPAQEAK